jgi:hypothetical protein
MNRESPTLDVGVIRTWLGLGPGLWPPDHYALLGLPPCECCLERIEQSVHERFVRIRPYQLSHPAQATEAMTRLAKALDCLTDPKRKLEYDRATFPGLPSQPLVPTARVPTTIDHDTAETPLPAEVLDQDWWAKGGSQPAWSAAGMPPPVRAAAEAGFAPEVAVDSASPPPVRSGTAVANQLPPVRWQVITPPPSSVAVESPAVAVAAPPAVAAGAPAAPPTAGESSTVVLSDSGKLRAMYLSAAAMREVGTRRDVYERLLWVRRLLRAWSRMGKYVHKQKRQLAKPGEDADFTRCLQVLDDLVQEVPNVIGQPGQPGYRLLSLAQREPVAVTFKGLDETQREALSLDWLAGRAAIAEFRQFLKRKIVGHRRLSGWQRFGAIADGLAAAHWWWVVLGLGLVGLVVLAIVYVG